MILIGDSELKLIGYGSEIGIQNFFMLVPIFAENPTLFMPSPMLMAIYA